MRVILNPENGAPIKNVQIRGQIYFKDKPFEADSMRKIENDQVADDLLSLFEFLKVLEDKEAIEEYLSEKKGRAFKCDKCDFASSVEIALKGHQRKHESEDKMTDELGIEVISDVPQEQLSNEELEKRREEAEKRHLESGGITAQWEDDTPVRGRVMA